MSILLFVRVKNQRQKKKNPKILWLKNRYFRCRTALYRITNQFVNGASLLYVFSFLFLSFLCTYCVHAKAKKGHSLLTHSLCMLPGCNDVMGHYSFLPTSCACTTLHLKIDFLLITTEIESVIKY